MLYQVSRNGQSYGPYTLEDLQRYLASGNVLPTDLAKSEDMPNWIPVSQLFPHQGTPASAPPMASAPPTYSAQPTYPLQIGNQYPDAPNLNWGLVLLFDVLTCSLFQYVWNLVVAAWVKRVQPSSTAIFYYIALTVLALFSGVFNSVFARHDTILAMHGGISFLHSRSFLPRVGAGIVVWVVKLIARFQQRESLLQHFNGAEPIGLQLSGVMTFFFGGLYFQYHLNRINAIKQANRYNTAAPRF